MNRARNIVTVASVALAVGLATGCASSQKPQLTAEGLPTWVNDACVGQPADTICAVGESELVAANVEAGKVDAETAALNRLQMQLEADIGRLSERLNQVTRDISNNRMYGQQTLNEVNRSFSERTIRGVRFVQYYYQPSRLEPKKVFVLAVVSPNTAKLSEDVMQSLLAIGERERLFNNAREAQLRYDAVRKQYLAEKAGQQGAAPAAPILAAPAAPGAQ